MAPGGKEYSGRRNELAAAIAEEEARLVAEELPQFLSSCTFV
jgi:hypothetical protein